MLKIKITKILNKILIQIEKKYMNSNVREKHNLKNF